MTFYGNQVGMSGNANRTASAADATGNSLDEATFKATMTPVKITGADLFVAAAAPTAGTVVKVRAVFYDADDALVGLSEEVTLTASDYDATIKNASGVGATRHLSGGEILIQPDAYQSRLLITSVSAVELCDFFLYAMQGE